MSVADTQQQKTRSTRGSVPMSRFKLNGVSMDVSVVEASVVSTDGQHDEARVTVTSSTLETTDDLVDQPISFYWGVAPRAETFAGYIMSVEEKSGGATGALTFSMVIFGATKAMFQGSPQFWSRRSVPSAVSELAGKDGLGFYGHPHTYLWKALAQTEETDWTMAQKLTSKIGWRLWQRYGCLLCYDPLKLFQESGSYARLYMGTPEDYTTDRQLLEFQPMEVSTVEKAQLGSKYGYFNEGTVQVATEPGEFKGYKFNTDTVIEDSRSAATYIEAGSTDLDTWKQSAMARTWGDADIFPGMCVEVITTNRRYLKAKYDGKWLVRGTSHQMDRQQYQTMLYLVRPSSKAAVSTATYTPFWRMTDVSAAKPSLSINDGRWLSSKAGTMTYMPPSNIGKIVDGDKLPGGPLVGYQP